MYSEWLLPTISLAVFVWLGILSYLVWKQNLFLRSLFPKSGERDIRKKFEEILKLEEKSDILARESKLNIQKIALVRFNPYQDTGGDQSFSLALLDAKGDGLVLTSLHTRSGTRIFAKPVVGGKATTHQFAMEEIEVIRKALEN